MEKSKTFNKSKWSKIVILTILTSFAIELFISLLLTVHRIFSESLTTGIPWTLHSLGELICLVGIIWIVFKFKSNVQEFIAILIILSFISFIIGPVIQNAQQIVKYNYYGIEEIYHENTNCRYYTLYHHNSEDLRFELLENGKVDRTKIKAQGFLFWQTGLVKGFRPDKESIPQYNGCNNFFQWLLLVMIVGPSVLLELFIQGIIRNLVLLILIQIFFFKHYKYHIWWQKSTDEKEQNTDGNKEKRKAIDRKWEKLGKIGNHWKLLNFNEEPTPIWEEYCFNYLQRSINKDTNSEDLDKTKKLVNDCKDKYNKHLNHISHWNGLCKKGEIVQVVHVDPYVIILSKNWKGEISDHSDLEIWLAGKQSFLNRHINYQCEIYNFGTLSITEDSPEVLIGSAEPGDYKISHRVGSYLWLYREKNKSKQTVFLNSENKTIKIEDALFQIID